MSSRNLPIIFSRASASDIEATVGDATVLSGVPPGRGWRGLWAWRQARVRQAAGASPSGRDEVPDEVPGEARVESGLCLTALVRQRETGASSGMQVRGRGSAWAFGEPQGVARAPYVASFAKFELGLLFALALIARSHIWALQYMSVCV